MFGVKKPVLEKSKLIVVNLTPKRSEEEATNDASDNTTNKAGGKQAMNNNKSVDSNNNNNNTENNRKALEDEVDNLVEELLRIGDGKISMKSHTNAGNKPWKQQARNSNNENLNISAMNVSDYNPASRFDMNDRTPISTSSKSKANNLDRSSGQPDQNENNQQAALHVSSNSSSHDILNVKTSNYYNGVMNKEVDFSSSQTYVRDPIREQQQHSAQNTSKKTKKSNFTYRSDLDTDAIINMNDNDEEENDEVSGGNRSSSGLERIRLINFKVNRVFDEENGSGHNNNSNTNNESTSSQSQRAQTFYNGKKVWTAATDDVE